MMNKINSNKRLLLEALKKSQSPMLDETMNIVGERVKGPNLKKSECIDKIGVDEEINPLDEIQMDMGSSGTIFYIQKLPLNKIESAKELE
jgi:hypothetical protein